MTPKKQIDKIIHTKNIAIRTISSIGVMVGIIASIFIQDDRTLMRILGIVIILVYWISCIIIPAIVDRKRKAMLNDQLISDADEIATLIFDKKLATNTNVKEIIHAAENILQKQKDE